LAYISLHASELVTIRLQHDSLLLPAWQNKSQIIRQIWRVMRVMTLTIHKVVKSGAAERAFLLIRHAVSGNLGGLVDMVVMSSYFGLGPEYEHVGW
jgi:hypothetical protein